MADKQGQVILFGEAAEKVRSERQARDPNWRPPPDPRRTALLGMLVVLLLVLGGLGLVHLLHHMSEIQDCVLSGRSNCAPIDVPAADH